MSNLLTNNQNRDIVFSVLKEEHKKGRSVIVITHDEITAQTAKQKMVLVGGKLHESK